MEDMCQRQRWCEIKCCYLSTVLLAFVKHDIRTLADSFFSTVRDKDCTPDAYMTNYDKPIDDNMKKVAMKYTLDKDILLITPLATDSPSNSII